MVDTDTVIFSNTRGFQVKRDEINHFIQTQRPLVFLIAEHFQSSSFYLELSGYQLAAVYCRNIRERGGVAIFVKAGVGFVSRLDLDVFNVKRQFEVRSVEIPSRNLVVTVAYRPPSGSMAVFHSKLESVLRIYNREPTKRHVMAGDFNVDSNNNRTERTLQACNLQFMLSSMTHEGGKCLDNFIADFTPLGQEVMRQRFSDHCCIRMVLPQIHAKKEVLNDIQALKAQRGPEKYLVFNDYVTVDVADGSSQKRPTFVVADNSSRRLPSVDVSDSSSSSAHSLDFANICPPKPFHQIHTHKVEIPFVFPKPNSVGSRSKMFTDNKKPILSKETVLSAILSEKDSLYEVKGVIKNILKEDDFLENFVSTLVGKVNEKLAEALSESLEDTKDQIRRLEDKVTILEAKIEYLEDNVIL